MFPSVGIRIFTLCMKLNTSWEIFCDARVSPRSETRGRGGDSLRILRTGRKALFTTVWATFPLAAEEACSAGRLVLCVFPNIHSEGASLTSAKKDDLIV